MFKITTKHYARILYFLASESGDVESAVNIFFTFLHKRHVLKKLDRILEDYAKYAEEQDGVKRIEITSARKLEKETIASIKKQFGEKVKTKEYIDDGILGGCVIREKNIILDGSVRTQLQRLKQCLLNK